MGELPSPGWSHDIKLRRDLALLADWDYGPGGGYSGSGETGRNRHGSHTGDRDCTGSGNSAEGHPMVAVAEGQEG